jgi:hypothetical protein
MPAETPGNMGFPGERRAYGTELWANGADHEAKHFAIRPRSLGVTRAGECDQRNRRDTHPPGCSRNRLR